MILVLLSSVVVALISPFFTRTRSHRVELLPPTGLTKVVPTLVPALEFYRGLRLVPGSLIDVRRIVLILARYYRRFLLGIFWKLSAV